MKIHLASPNRLILVSALVAGQSPSVLNAQERPLTVMDVRQVFSSGGDESGWDEFDIPEFLAAAYGARARPALTALLRERSTAENYFSQLLALTTAQYGRVGVPDDVVLEFATGRKALEAPGVLRHRALMALRMRPNPALREVWLQVAQERDPSYRQLAVGGLACALGTEALPLLEAMSADQDRSVTRVVEFYVTELTTKGVAALACGGKASRGEAGAFPRELRPSLRSKGAQLLQRIP